jgi:hypothetical protein
VAAACLPQGLWAASADGKDATTHWCAVSFTAHRRDGCHAILKAARLSTQLVCGGRGRRSEVLETRPPLAALAELQPDRRGSPAAAAAAMGGGGAGAAEVEGEGGLTTAAGGGGGGTLAGSTLLSVRIETGRPHQIREPAVFILEPAHIA